MDKSELKNELQGFFDKLKTLEGRGRTLQNQNLADIAASASGKVKQLIDHPDVHLMADTQKDQALNPDGTPKAGQPFDPNAQDAYAIGERAERTERDRVEALRTQANRPPAPQPQPFNPGSPQPAPLPQQ